MLENPVEFNQSVETLFAVQKQAIDSGSVAGGQHLCFMGVGRDEEDKYVNMVVSHFLQRTINFVSLALGGYDELRRAVEDPEMIVGTDVQTTRAEYTKNWVKKINVTSKKLMSFYSIIFILFSLLCFFLFSCELKCFNFMFYYISFHIGDNERRRFNDKQILERSQNQIV